MTLTAQDRKDAAEHAQRRWDFHRQRGTVDQIVADDMDGMEAIRRGLLGEYECQHVFGSTVDVELRAGGDGGQDFFLHLRVADHPVRFRVDVKTSSFEGDRDLTWLLVRKHKIEKQVIYIHGQYISKSDDVELQGWAWGVELIRRNEIRVLTSKGIENYSMPVTECRSIDELLARIVYVPTPEEVEARRGFVGEDRGHLVHYCHCGKWGFHGHEVDTRKGKLGVWFCGEHKPAD